MVSHNDCEQVRLGGLVQDQMTNGILYLDETAQPGEATRNMARALDRPVRRAHETIETLGWLDSYRGLAVPFFATAFGTFLLRQFMLTIPQELEDAARIDGANAFQTFIRIILPLSTPGMATLAIYNAVILWNEFVFSFVRILSPERRTLPLAIWEYQGEYAMDIPAVMAVLTLSALPLILVFIVAQERVIKGMMAGALK